jgi:autotransporter-associated beta strand protein
MMGGKYVWMALKRRTALSLGLATTLWASGAPTAQAQFNFGFNSEGPAPITASGDAAMSRDIGGVRGSYTGAIQAILTDPNSANTMFIGGTNGGVWRTTNGGQTWTPLTDNQSSLSIASLAYKGGDSQTIYAGIGLTSNGAFGNNSPADRGGARTGILYSSNGGTSWQQLGGAGALQGKSVVGVAARGDVVLAATAELNDAGATAGYGLYRSVGGGNFQLVTGLPAGPAYSVVGQGTQLSPYYVTIAGAGVYKSVDNGAGWLPVQGPTVSANQAARVSLGPNGSVAVAVFDTRANNGETAPTGGKLVALYLAPDGTNFKTLQVPAVNTGNQANTNLTIAIDKTNPNIVYVAGDVSPIDGAVTLAAYRVTLQPDGKSVVQTITDDGTANNSTVHADARAFAFDSSGRLLLVTDGGIYTRTNPQNNSGVWSGLNTSSLALLEAYAVAYDAVSKRLVVAAQDNGPAIQDKSRGPGFTGLTTGDGTNAAVNDRTHAGSAQSIVYTSIQNLGFLRRQLVGADGGSIDNILLLGAPTAAFDANNNVIQNKSNPIWNFYLGTNSTNSDFVANGAPGKLPFASRLVLNRYDPSHVAIGTNYVYTTTDQKMLDAYNGVDSNPLTNVSPQDGFGKPIRIGPISAIAYGTGVGNNNPFANAMVVGADSQAGERLYFSADVTATNLAVKPNYLGQAPTSLVFDGLTSQRFFVADGANLWRTGNAGDAFDNNLTARLGVLGITRPTSVEFISFNGVNALLTGGIRSDPFAQSPIAVGISRDGVLDPLQPFGVGLPNTMVNLLAYNSSVDVLAVSLWGRGIWTLYDVSSYFPTADKLIYGLAGNDSAPDPFYLSNGEKASRPLEKYGAGTLTLSGTASYKGPTTVFGGTMVVNGSIASSSGLNVNPGATLTGGGIVPATIMSGVIAPGMAANGPTMITVNKSYTQTAGSTYLAGFNAAGQSDRIAVNGTASIQGGSLVATAQGSGIYAPRTTYTLVSTTGGLSGGFSSYSLATSPFLQPSFTSDANNLYLNLTINGFLAAAQTPLQAAVGAAIDSSVYSATGDYATVLGTLASLTPSQMPSILTSLSGMNYSGFSNSMVQGAQLFMSNFLSQASSANRGLNKIALAEACDVACDTPEPAKWGVWGGGLGGLGTVGAGQPLGGVTYNLGGFAAGLDRKITDTALAGVTVGYTGGTQWVSGFSGQGYSDTFLAGLYGGYAEGPVYLDGVVGYAYTSNRLSRSLIIPGLAARTATGQAGANQVYGQVEGGYRFDVGTPAAAFVTPFARLQAYSGAQNAFTENGAQSLSLSVAGQTTNSFRSVIGAQIGGAMDLGWREKLGVQLRLGWSHEYADTNRPVTASFVGAPSAPFTTYGIGPQRDGAVVGLAANTAIAEATSVYLRYEGNISGQDGSHALTAGVRMSW